MEETDSPEGFPSRKDRKIAFGVSLFLVALVFVVFGQTCRFQFVNYDDAHHVYANPAVTNGLTWSGIARVFQHSHNDYWHPLDFVSHMVDCQFYGLNPAGHHLTNVLLHAITAVLLFLVLRQMTGALWPGAFVAAVFAIHPLRVESVAWISERKDILEGLFFMLTLAAYTRYARQPWSWARYLAVMIFFVLGLMSKPTLMALPFLLLLLDYWPLGRFAGKKNNIAAFSCLVMEKIPFFILSLASCVEAATGNSLAFTSSGKIPASLQIANALSSYLAYLQQTLWPVNLAVLYPFPVEGVPFERLCFAVIALVSISTGAVLMRKKRPYLFVGWFWYLIMLAPMIGFVQAGAYARADRYTYLPQVGIILLVAWVAKDLFLTWQYRRTALAVVATTLVVALAICSWKQTSYWRDSETLWRHALTCTSSNSIAHGNLGAALAAKGRYPDAVEQFQTALAINPYSADVYFNLAVVLTKQDHTVTAIQNYQKAIELKPDYVQAEKNLGILLASSGRPDEAIRCFEKALAIEPDDAEADNNLGITLASQGHLSEAVGFFRQAIATYPQYADAHFNLANALALQGKTVEAIHHYQEALKFNPNYEAARRQLRALKLQ